MSAVRPRSKRPPILDQDSQCPQCGLLYHYDEGRRCWACDGRVCPHCITEGPQPLCPECIGPRRLKSLSPMLASLGTVPDDEAGWAAEFKWDGIRALTYWDGASLRIESRNGINVTARYPEFSDLGRLFGSRSIILDGEIVAMDEHGYPSFHQLQKRMHLNMERVAQTARHVPAFYLIFDVLHADGKSLLRVPYEERRELLEERALVHRYAMVPPATHRDLHGALRAAREHHLEGIVCKRLNSVYQPGLRSRQWIKVKIIQTREFVIGGWIHEENNSRRIGSILLGYYDESGLRYVGKVGTGFDHDDHQLLFEKFSRLERRSNPFVDRIPKKNVVYLAPKLVAEIEYRRWPKEGMVQQGAFKGLRSDKDAVEIQGREAA